MSRPCTVKRRGRDGTINGAVGAPIPGSSPPVIADADSDMLQSAVAPVRMSGRSPSRLIDERKDVRYAFVGLGDCDVVGVTLQHEQPRVRNLLLILEHR